MLSIAAVLIISMLQFNGPATAHCWGKNGEHVHPPGCCPLEDDLEVSIALLEDLAACGNYLEVRVPARNVLRWLEPHLLA